MESMIKSELRIGNKVKYNDVTWTVTQLFKGQASIEHIEGGYGSYKYEFLQPIPLTKDILLKCGFEQLVSNNEENIFLNGRLKIWLGIRQSLCFIKDEDKNDCYYIPNSGIGSLHQLQNLYYALTNKELLINLS